MGPSLKKNGSKKDFKNVRKMDTGDMVHIYLYFPNCYCEGQLQQCYSKCGLGFATNLHWDKYRS